MQAQIAANFFLSPPKLAMKKWAAEKYHVYLIKKQTN